MRLRQAKKVIKLNLIQSQFWFRNIGVVGLGDIQWQDRHRIEKARRRMDRDWRKRAVKSILNAPVDLVLGEWALPNGKPAFSPVRQSPCWLGFRCCGTMGLRQF